MLGYDFDGRWTYGYCESCMKNADEKIKMIRERISGKVMWVCPQCGATKRF